VRAYLESALALQPYRGALTASSGEEAVEWAVKELIRAARAYLPISHLLWGLWGLIQVSYLLPANLLLPLSTPNFVQKDAEGFGVVGL